MTQWSIQYANYVRCAATSHVGRCGPAAALLLVEAEVEIEVEVEIEAEVEVELEEAAGGAEVSEADEAAVVGRGEVGRGALLLRAVRERVRVRVRQRMRVRVRVRVHGREAGAALHQAVEVERDAVAGRADLDAGDLVVVA